MHLPSVDHKWTNTGEGTTMTSSTTPDMSTEERWLRLAVHLAATGELRRSIARAETEQRPDLPRGATERRPILDVGILRPFDTAGSPPSSPGGRSSGGTSWCATSTTSREPVPGPAKMKTRKGRRARTPSPIVVKPSNAPASAT